MLWQDLGLVFRIQDQSTWMKSHGYVPTAIMLHDRIRVFFASLDANRIGRIGFVDLDRADPTRVIEASDDPALDIGPTGAFDEHGVTPMSLVRLADGGLRLYYAGWQRTEGARYLLFNGMATSSDDGRTFTRNANVPVFERSDRHYLVRTGFVILEGGTWKCWCAQSDRLIDVDGKVVPSYSLGFMESTDGIHWPETAEVCLRADDEVFGYGRSAVWRESNGEWNALLSLRRRGAGYAIRHGTSTDGRHWDLQAVSPLSLMPEQTVDAQAETMFPSILRDGDRMLMFYNGDGFGREGIRLAVNSV